MASRTAITPATLDQYIASYELAPGFVLTVAREGSSLFAQATGQGKAEIFPEAEGKFFYESAFIGTLRPLRHATYSVKIGALLGCMRGTTR